MQQLEDTRPEIPAIGADARDEIASMVRAVPLDAARRRSRGGVVAGVTFGTLALTAGAAVAVTSGLSFGSDEAGEGVWDGTVPSGLVCTSQMRVADDATRAAEESVEESDLAPYREALADVMSGGLQVDDARVAASAGWRGGHWVGGKEVLDTLPTAHYTLEPRGDGTWVFEYSEPAYYFEYTGDVDDVAVDSGETMVGYIRVDAADGEAYGAAGFSTNDELPPAWVIDTDGDDVIVREATPAEFAAYAERTYGSAELTLEDVEYLDAASLAIDEAMEAELFDRGLYGIEVEWGGGPGVYTPIDGGWIWSCK